MKNQLNLAALTKIADNMQKAHSAFDVNAFIDPTLKAMQPLELKDRVHCIIDNLHIQLPDDFEKTHGILLEFEKHWRIAEKLEEGDAFAIWPVIDYVGVHGLEYPEHSFEVLAALTSHFSAEFAIRPFINQYPKLSLAQLKLWAKSEDYHLRRLASEGIRPRLPWGGQLKQYIKDPSDIFDILELLKYDDEDYVMRSVANNLNDIAKDHPERMVELCFAWQQECATDKSKNQNWIIKHASRSLIKQGFEPAFKLLGYSDQIEVEIRKFTLKSDQIKMNQSIEFDIEIENQADQKYVIDYAVHFMKKNGQMAPKMFKLKNVDVKSGELCKISKSHPIKPISTRKYYPGNHAIELFLNGKSMLKLPFDLEV